MLASALTDRVRALAEATAEGSDVYVLDVVMKGGDGGPAFEVVVDTDAGVGVDELARFSHELGFALDTADNFDVEHYTLNVTSPGATKPLALPRQYPRHVGRSLVVKLAAPEGGGEGQARVEGVLAAVDLGAGTFSLQPPTPKREKGGPRPETPAPVTVAFADVAEAKVQLPW